MNLNDTNPAGPHRVAFLIPHYVGGGAERISLLLARGLRDRHGHDVEIWATRFNPDCRREVEDTGFRTASPRDTRPRVRHGSDGNVREVARMVMERRIDTLVVAVSPLGDMPLLRILVGRECRIVFHLHGTPFWELVSLTTRAPWPKSPGRWLQRAWHDVTHDLREGLFHTYSRRVMRQYRGVYDSCDRIVTLCRRYSDDLDRRLEVAPGLSKAVAVLNPVDLKRFMPCAAQPKGREVLYVGRLTPTDKRVDRLLRVWKRVSDDFPGWRLRIVGDGPERDNLEDMSAGMGLERVTFEGFRDPVTYYASASVVAMTSSFEGWPGAMVEALAAGCRPIAFNCGGGMEEILSGGRGTLVEPFDEEAYAGALATLMRNHETEADKGALPPEELPAREDITAWLAALSPEAAADRWHTEIV